MILQIGIIYLILGLARSFPHNQFPLNDPKLIYLIPEDESFIRIRRGYDTIVQPEEHKDQQQHTYTGFSEHNIGNDEVKLNPAFGDVSGYTGEKNKPENFHKLQNIGNHEITPEHDKQDEHGTGIDHLLEQVFGSGTTDNRANIHESHSGALDEHKNIGYENHDNSEIHDHFDGSAGKLDYNQHNVDGFGGDKYSHSENEEHGNKHDHNYEQQNEHNGYGNYEYHDEHKGNEEHGNKFDHNYEHHDEHKDNEEHGNKFDHNYELKDEHNYDNDDGKFEYNHHYNHDNHKEDDGQYHEGNYGLDHYNEHKEDDGQYHEGNYGFDHHNEHEGDNGQYHDSIYGYGHHNHQNGGHYGGYGGYGGHHGYGGQSGYY